MKTLQLNLKTNDLCLNSQGDLSLCSGDEALVQNVGTALSIWAGEIPFTPLAGINYDHFFLENQNQTGDLLLAMEREAQKVTFVKSAKLILEKESNSRILNGKIKIVKSNEDIIYASF